MERLAFDNVKYEAIEGAIHISRYALAEQVVKDRVVLDIACGAGYGSFLISKWGAKQVYGVDVSEEAIKMANKNFKKENIIFSLGNGEDLSQFEDNFFDSIVSFETIEHLKDPVKFLKELKRISKKGAPIIISCPNDFLYFSSDAESNPYHMKKYRFDEFVKLTTKVLGKKYKAFMGVFVNGYANLALDNMQHDKKAEQIKMLDYDRLETKFLPQDSEIPTEECPYYVMAWNCDLKNTSITYPYSLNWIMSMQKVADEKIGVLHTENENLRLENAQLKALLYKINIPLRIKNKIKRANIFRK